ncbi:MAG: hypothetical protein ACYS0G_15920 [Planctomycetota bacterium]|jgi:hypothetical protein
MGHVLRNALIVVAALALLGWILGYIAYGGGTSSDQAKAQFIAELEQFDAFDAHESLLLHVVDREHDGVYRKNQYRRRGQSILDSDGYRAQMYFRLVTALRDAGHADVAVQLDRYRARQG